MKLRIKLIAALLFLSFASACAASDSPDNFTQEPENGEEIFALNDDKPFAEVHLVMQVSDADPVHYQAALDIANNLSRHYGGPDFVDIQIVSFGAGVPMVFAENNKNATRISSLIEHGVRFYVCGNTLDTIERKTGRLPQILPDIIRVQTGVAFLIDEINRGYLHLHP